MGGKEKFTYYNHTMIKAIDTSVIEHNAYIQCNYPIILMRHGKADYTKAEDSDLVSVEGTLNTTRIGEISQTSNEIALFLNSRSITNIALFTSPKQRCLQTSEIVMKELTNGGYIVDYNISSELRDVITLFATSSNEGSYTRWERGLSEGENWMDNWLKVRDFLPGEESPEQLINRLKKFFTHITITKPTILICHEEVFYAIAKILQLEWHKPTYAEAWILS